MSQSLFPLPGPFCRFSEIISISSSFYDQKYDFCLSKFNIGLSNFRLFGEKPSGRIFLPFYLVYRQLGSFGKFSSRKWEPSIFPRIASGVLCGVLCGVLSGVLCGVLSGVLYDIAYIIKYYIIIAYVCTCMYCILYYLIIFCK